MKEEQGPQVNKKRLGKIIGLFFGFWLLLVALLFIALQFATVQTFAVNKITDFLNKKTGYPISIEHVTINWLDELELNGVIVRDDQDSLMIGIERAIVDFSINGLLNPAQPGLDGIELFSPEVNLYKNTADSGLNINGFIKSLQALLPTKKNTGKKLLPFVVGELVVHNAQFGFHNQYQGYSDKGFDYNHFDIDVLEANTRDFIIFADTIRLKINQLSAYLPEHDFNIDTLRTNFIYSSHSMNFGKLMLKAGNSTLKDSMAFAYRNQSSLGYFTDSVKMAINFKNSHLESADLEIFIPAIGLYKDNYDISGRFRGKLSQFTVKDLYAHFGQRSLVAGQISIDGLPKASEAFLDLELEASRLYPDDLKPYLDEVLVKNLRALGETNFSGQFLGFPNDFVANGSFYTKLGLIKSDINVKLAQNAINSTYSGSLALFKFDLGKFTQEPLLGTISMNGSVEGSGLSLNTAQMNLKATVPSLFFNKYEYTNIQANGKLAQRFFNGQVLVNDPNLTLDGTTTVDFRNKLSHIVVNAALDTARLLSLKILKDTLNIHGNINLDMYGLNLAEITGQAKISDFSIQYKDRRLALDSLFIASSTDSGNRTLELKTNLLDFNATGNWEYEAVVRDFQRLYTEYKLNFENNAQAITDYYEQKQIPEVYDKYRLRYSLQMHNPNPITQLLFPKLYISENTNFAGSFTSGYTNIFTANTTIDTVVWDQHWFYGLQADLNTSKVADSTSVLASAYVFSELQHIEGATETENFQAEAIWNQDHMEVTAEAKQARGDNYAELASDIYFKKDRTTIAFNTLEAKLLDNIWRVANKNLITVRGSEIDVDNLVFSNKKQRLSIQGNLSQRTSDTLLIGLENIQLANINPILDKKLGGRVNGQLYLQEVLKKPVYKGNLRVDSLTLNGFLAGDFQFKGDWNRQEERLYTAIDGWRKGQKMLTASGYFNPTAEDNKLNLNARFTKAPLNLLEPFFGTMFSQISGTTTGNILVLGSPTAPVLRGKSSVENGKFKVNYLNTSYSFLGDIVFSENEIGFRQINLKDQDGNDAYLEGGVFHDGFTNFVIDLKAELQSTQVLNTTLEDNTLYYGTAYATGKVEVLGPASNLVISATARSEKGTKIYIPIDYDNKISGADFINFVSRSDTSTSVLSRQKAGLTGIKLDFDLDITPDAYCEIIFDLRAGDIIRGRGNGKLELTVDTEGNFDMFGTYEIEQGAYNFTLFNIITKEFTVIPGSTIRWLGDPYGGQLDIKAQYEQYASLSPLIPETSTGIAVPNRPYPVNLQMNLSGDLLAPSIAFDIDVPEYPMELNLDMMGVMSKLQNDEQLLNRQVFNLLVLRQFAPINYGSPNTEQTGGFSNQAVGFGSQTAVSSISELLANQFSALASQIDQNLEIDVNFSTNIQQDAVNTFQLRLSYTFLDGRLRVTRDGSISSRQDNTTNNYLGDWMVEYRLTPDGQFRVKLFRRLSSSQIVSTFNSENAYTHGFSILQTKSFNGLKELLQKKEPKTPLPIPIPDNEPGDLILMVPSNNRSNVSDTD